MVGMAVTTAVVAVGKTWQAVAAAETVGAACMVAMLATMWRRINTLMVMPRRRMGVRSTMTPTLTMTTTTTMTLTMALAMAMMRTVGATATATATAVATSTGSMLVIAAVAAMRKAVAAVPIRMQMKKGDSVDDRPRHLSNVVARWRLDLDDLRPQI